VSDKREVVGWLLVDDTARLLVREPAGLSLQSVSAACGFGQLSVQTGSYRRGAAIVDPTTHQTMGYEMEWLPGPLELRSARINE
jgi:hypothetical protein